MASGNMRRTTKMGRIYDGERKLLVTIGMHLLPIDL